MSDKSIMIDALRAAFQTGIETVEEYLNNRPQKVYTKKELMSILNNIKNAANTWPQQNEL